MAGGWMYGVKGGWQRDRTKVEGNGGRGGASKLQGVRCGPSCRSGNFREMGRGPCEGMEWFRFLT